jgi:hypothetical protein
VPPPSWKLKLPLPIFPDSHVADVGKLADQMHQFRMESKTRAAKKHGVVLDAGGWVWKAQVPGLQPLAGVHRADLPGLL